MAQTRPMKTERDIIVKRINKARRRIARGTNVAQENDVIDRLLLRLATLDTPWPSLESFMKRYTA